MQLLFQFLNQLASAALGRAMCVRADTVGSCRIDMHEQQTRLYCFLSNFILMLSLWNALAETFTNELRMTLKIVLHSAPASDLFLWHFLDKDPAVHKL